MSCRRIVAPPPPSIDHLAAMLHTTPAAVRAAGERYRDQVHEHRGRERETTRFAAVIGLVRQVAGRRVCCPSHEDARGPRGNLPAAAIASPQERRQ